MYFFNDLPCCSVDLSSYCMADPFGPQELVLALRPQGTLALAVGTRWLERGGGGGDELSEFSDGSSCAGDAVDAAEVPMR
jgi:hypothetical protein